MTADGWLALELDRVWLHADTCLRSLQAAGLRPAATGDLAVVLAARARSAPADPERALARARAEVLAARARSPISSLGVLEAETLVLAIAPHVDPALVELFAAVRGARRPVDLALVIQLHRLARAERAALLAVLDPAGPLRTGELIDIGPIDPTSASATTRPIYPSFRALALAADWPVATPRWAPPELAYYTE